jgi:Zn-dependent peptidase ImmA (M78 family)
MPAKSYAKAVRAGTLAAARLHMRLGSENEIAGSGGNVDVFRAIHTLELPLLLRPLQKLLGAFITAPAPGVLVTTQRPMSVQRFTAAHELGHYCMGHRPSLDDDEILRRMQLPSEAPGDSQEVEANAFAAEFLIPRWLIQVHAARQGWTVAEFRNPHYVYQLSLRIGASYEATCWTLVRQRLISQSSAAVLLRTQRRDIKESLLSSYEPTSFRGDVWLLTERDAGTRIDGSRNDLFVLRLHEHSGGGYLWDIDQLKQSGFGVVRDELEAMDGEGVGGSVIRRVTAEVSEPYRGRIVLDERRPWDPDEPISTLNMDVDLTGPEEEGLSRAERRSLLEAA